MKTRTLLYTILFLLISACTSTNVSDQKLSDAVQLMRHAESVARGGQALDNVSKADNLIKKAQENIMAGNREQADMLLDESMKLSKQVIDTAFVAPAANDKY